MPNAAAPAVSAQQTPPITRPFGDQDRDQSADESWSAVDSDNDLVTQNGNASRSLKRKRPLTVSLTNLDRAQPSCGWCSRNGQSCEYKERKKPGLRAGYGKELEQRLDRLEEVIQTQARLIETHILQSQPRSNHEFPHPGPHSYSSPSEPSAAHGPSPRNAAYFHEPSSVPAHPRPSDASITSPSDISVRNVMHSHLTSGLNPPIPIPQVSDTTHASDYTGNESSLKVPVNLFSNQEQSFADPELDLPPYDLLYALVDLYFDHINSWCPILHRRTTLDTFFGPSPLEEADRMVLYAIVATTLRFSSDSRLNEQNRKRYHDSSKQKVLLYGLENSSVRALQALVILALDLVGSSNGPPGWKLLALITRSVVQLGLAVESKSSLIAPVYPSIYTLRAVTLPDSESWIEDEGRRRLFWMVYFLDRYSTLATAFDFTLDDKDIDRKLPCKDEFFMKNQPVETRWFHHSGDRADYLKRAENVGSFGLYVEILGIMSRIHTFLKRPVDIGALSDVEEWQATYRKLDGELAAWEFGLPAEYAYENSSRLFNGSKSNKGLPCDWVQLHATYQTPDIIFFVDTLAQMGTYWKVAERYSTILQRVLDEYGEYQQSGVEDSERVTPSSVKILADMRRCAFDLDFLISRQPRSSPAGSQPTVPTPAAHPRNLAPNELEYLDVFGFFNVPRVPAARAPDITDLDINETVNNPMSINGLTGSVVDGAAPNANEFNITNYLIPTPETDWLFRSEG
ncbi:unnamed protein product [Aspergillus oryzae]|nr:unnamed protein product [Aspergillus oryzae]GMF90076.1 unnamed protein product [Aspergillus oryzae]GMG08317.1 unnamed protein product [Aspergillus oryzae]